LTNVTPYPATYEYALSPAINDEVGESVRDLRSGARSQESGVRRILKLKTYFGIVQGGVYPDLRKQSAEELIEMDFDGYALSAV